MKHQQKISGTSRPDSGFRRFCRLCCCRNGFYPLLVAPFITASFLLDVFCTFGCGFITLNVGFRPINGAWKEQILRFGLFNLQSGEEGSNLNIFMNNFHPGCVAFSDVFREFFVTGDKTWVMSQIMGIVSGCAGCLATVVIWLMVISPIPVCFLWPGILLPASLVAFLAGAAKFLFFDIEICRSNLWLKDDGDTTPLTAQSCALGMDATLSIISSVLALACVLLVCLRAPKRKNFNDSIEMPYPNYGADIQNLRTYSMEDSVDESESRLSIDIETQQSRSIQEKKCAYDLQSIHELPPKKMLQDDYMMTTIPLHRNPSLVSDGASVRSAKKVLKVKRRVNPESERLRQAEPSIEYTEKELHNILKDKSNNNIQPPETPPLNPTSTIQNKSESTQQLHSSPFLKGGNYKRSLSNMFSPGAPSDEGSFIFRSPLQNMMGGGNIPTSSPGSSRRSTPSKKKNSSKKKSSSGKKTTQTSNKTQKYDEALIQKCVVDLHKSFTDDQLPGNDNIKYHRT